MKISRNLNLRIGIDTSSLSLTIRGIGTYTLALIQALEEHKPLCYHPPNATDALFPHLSHHHFFTPPKLPFFGSLASLLHHRCFDKVDLVIFPDPKILYGKKPKNPFLLTIHDLMPLKFPHFFPKKSGALMRFFLPRYLREASALIAVSTQTKEDLLSYFPFVEGKVHVIPCALPLQKRLPVQKAKDPFLLYIGSFEQRKNLPGIIRAFAKIKAQGYPHTLIIAGKEEKNQKIPYELIKELRLEDHVLCKGYVSQSEKQALLQKTACLIWPSFYEGFGLPLLEALTQGAPIVTSKISVLEEVCGQAAIYVDPHSPDSIAKGIEKSLASDSFWQAGLQRAELFSLRRFKEKFIDLIEAVK